MALASSLFRGARRAASPRWHTWSPPRARVLGIARTLTSATRLMDVLTLLDPADGIEVSCTVNPGSVFADGLPAYFAELGVPVVPWEEAVRRRWDLALACAVHPSMRRVRGPLMVLPHGAGYNRLVRESTGDGASPAGLSRRELTHRGQVVPAAIGVSHEEQLRRLAGSCPPAAGRALVVGDWCFDRVRASLPLRDVFRERLGVGSRRLVVLHSTWGEHSLLGRCPELPRRLLSALPVDEYAVAAVLHPNVWARAGRYAVFRRLAEEVDAGLTLIPPDEGWRATIIAGDVVVGDHGSTSFYGSALDRVTLLAATGAEELDPRSPAFAFGGAAPRLDPDADPLAQITAAFDRFETGGREADARTAEGPAVPGPAGGPGDPRTALRAVAASQLGAPGEAGTLLRRRMYAFLAPCGLPAPAAPPEPRPVPPPPELPRREPVAYAVTGAVLPGGAVTVRRFPAFGDWQDAEDGFFAVTDLDRHTLRPNSWEVMARTVLEGELSPVAWLAAKALAHPHLNVLVSRLDRDRCLVRLRGGRLLEARAVRHWGEPVPALDPVLLGSAVNLAWMYDTSRDVEPDPTARLLAEGLRVRCAGPEDGAGPGPGPRLTVEFTAPPQESPDENPR
ncbi:hypothetical protein AB0J21_07210 [Streptomyces sp. NPDC049954]|uniref:hypothetical protein n=1 Tax=Streptomyces sp. NPDC049954 TaxID=3155779 RepID=UPI003438668C